MQPRAAGPCMRVFGEYFFFKIREIPSMAGNWPRGIQRIPGTSPFVPHDSHLPIDSLYDKIPIQGLGPKFIACRQTLKPLVQFREILIGQCRVHDFRIVLIDPGCAPIVLWQEDGLVFFKGNDRVTVKIHRHILDLRGIGFHGLTRGSWLRLAPVMCLEAVKITHFCRRRYF